MVKKTQNAKLKTQNLILNTQNSKPKTKIKDSKKNPKRIIIREEYCMGCRLCEVYCLVQHSKTKNIIKAYKGEYPKPIPRIIVEEKGYVSFALQCRHCEDAPCIEACITGAMYRDKKTQAVLCDEEKCVGCWMCIMVCPFGVILRDVAGKKVASKCDLCIPNEATRRSDASGSRRDSKEVTAFGIGEEVPVCVKNCPNEAIIWENACAENKEQKNRHADGTVRRQKR